MTQVQSNPVDPHSLVALFPLIHHHSGCVGIALSADGYRWSRPTPVARCNVYGERAMNHPAGLARRNGQIWIYVHENVPGITIDRLTPGPLARQILRSPVAPPGRLVRYSLSMAWFREWTRRTLGSFGPAA